MTMYVKQIFDSTIFIIFSMNIASISVLHKYIMIMHCR